MRAMIWLALVLCLNLISIAALQASPPDLRGSIAVDQPPIRKVYP